MPHPGNPVQFGGKEYSSRKECCIEQGISPSNVLYWQRKIGCTVEEAIEYCINRKSLISERKRGFVYNGESYDSVSACCVSFGVSHGSVIWWRNKTGCTSEEALDRILKNKKVRQSDELQSCKQTRKPRGNPRGNHSKVFRFDGVCYDSFKACCIAKNLNYSTVSAYKRRTGCTPEEALEHYINRGKRKDGFVYNGKTYSSVDACCNSFGLCHSLVVYWKNKTNCTIEEAITHCLLPTKLKLLYTGRTTGKMYYSGTCRTCKRKLLLAEDELESFAHSDEFCEAHLLPWGVE